MFRIKICGITSVADAQHAVAAGADALGLNFYQGSPRCISIEAAQEIAASVPRETSLVGVFVDADEQFARRAADRVRLDYLQLHGSEPPETLSALGASRVIRAWRVDRRGLEPVFAYLRQCESLGALPAALLLDTFRKGQPGGTGAVFDWSVVQRWHDCPWADRIALVLAGGLNPTNVSRAIATVRPAAVDTASGVESSPGRKDPQQVAEFIRRAQSALGNNGPSSSAG